MGRIYYNNERFRFALLLLATYSVDLVGLFSQQSQVIWAYGSSSRRTKGEGRRKSANEKEKTLRRVREQESETTDQASEGDHTSQDEEKKKKRRSSRKTPPRDRKTINPLPGTKPLTNYSQTTRICIK